MIKCKLTYNEESSVCTGADGMHINLTRRERQSWNEKALNF